MPETAQSLTQRPVHSGWLSRETWRSGAVAATLCLALIVAIIAPRSLSFFPAVLGVLLTFAAYRRGIKGRNLIFAPAFVFIGLFCGMGALSALWSVDPALSFEKAGSTALILTGCGLLFSAALNATLAPSQKNTQILAGVLPPVVMLMGVFCIIELYSGAPVYHFLRGESMGQEAFNFSHLNKNVLIFILCFLPALHGLRVTPMRKPVRIAGIVALFAIAAIVMWRTESQSAHLAFALGLLFYLFFPVARGRYWSFLTALIFLLLFASPWIAQFLYAHLANPLHDLPWFSSGYASSRMEIWDFVARRALDSPLLGFGMESTRVFQDFDNAALYHSVPHVLHPHNFALQLWIEFGVFGPALATLFLGYALKAMRDLPVPNARLCLGMLVAALLVASTAFGLWQSWWLGLLSMLFSIGALLGAGNAPAAKNSI